MLTDQNHGYADPAIPIGRQMPLNAAVRIGSGSWLSVGAVVLPGACVGRNVVIAAGSVVRGTVPDRCVVAGVPARVIRSYQPGDGWSPPLPSALPPLDRLDDDALVNGAALDGTALNRAALDGTALDGTALDGTALDRAALDGAALVDGAG